jgi:hypothetical protein
MEASFILPQEGLWDNVFFCIEGSSLENHGPWPCGWHDHVILTQKYLKELMELQNVAWIGF